MEEAFFWVLGLGIVGARLYHVTDYWERYYQFNLGKIPAVWDGGLGIWGGIVGALMGVFLYCMFRRKNIWPLLDAFTIGAPLAQAVGRVGNFVNGELVGKNGEPLFAYEAILNLALFGFLWKEAQRDKVPGKIFGRYLAGYGIVRILLENLRPNGVIWRIGGVPTAVIFGVIAIISGMAVFLVVMRKRS